MEAAALVALCTMLAHAGATGPFPPGVDCRSGDIPPVRISAKAAPADAAELTGLGARRLSALAVARFLIAINWRVLYRWLCVNARLKPNALSE